MSKQNIENIAKSDRNFTQTFVNHHILKDINFNGHRLIKNNISIPKIVMNLNNSYIPNPWLRNFKHRFYIKYRFYINGSVRLTKNADLDKYKYSGYVIGFDSRSDFSFTDGSMGKNIIIFGAGKG